MILNKNKYFKYYLLASLIIFFIVLLIYFLGSPEKNEVTNNYQEIDSSDIVPENIKDFGLSVNKIDLLVPVVRNVDGQNKEEYNKVLERGLAHYAGTALPNEVGNIFIFGHSSSDEISGEYARIFEKLSHLEEDDLITVYYQGGKYHYQVKDKIIVEPTDLSVLEKGSEKKLSLMTCWPLGTIDKRLVVRAYKIEQ